jgi:prevent-host-death family protein
MKRISITDAKNGLSALIDSVKSGSSFLIVDRGRPVARLEPVAPARDLTDDERLARLIRDGIVTPARSRLPKSFFDEPLPKLKNGASAVQALLDERREGR